MRDTYSTVPQSMRFRVVRSEYHTSAQVRCVCASYLAQTAVDFLAADRVPRGALSQSQRPINCVYKQTTLVPLCDEHRRPRPGRRAAPHAGMCRIHHQPSLTNRFPHPPPPPSTQTDLYEHECECCLTAPIDPPADGDPRSGVQRFAPANGMRDAAFVISRAHPSSHMHCLHCCCCCATTQAKAAVVGAVAGAGANAVATAVFKPKEKLDKDGNVIAPSLATKVASGMAIAAVTGVTGAIAANAVKKAEEKKEKKEEAKAEAKEAKAEAKAEAIAEKNRAPSLTNAEKQALAKFHKKDNKAPLIAVGLCCCCVVCIAVIAGIIVAIVAVAGGFEDADVDSGSSDI